MRNAALCFPDAGDAGDADDAAVDALQPSPSPDVITPRKRTSPAESVLLRAWRGCQWR